MFEVHRPDCSAGLGPDVNCDTGGRYLKDSLDLFSDESSPIVDVALVPDHRAGRGWIRLSGYSYGEIDHPDQRGRVAGSAGRTENQSSHQQHA
jgi:hypothetical protein